MMDPSNEDSFAPREGLFDAQLSFAVPFVDAPTPIRAVVKRDGREEPFQQRKIAQAIYKAAQSIGGDDYDRAESLARGVTIYLAKNVSGAPTVDQVHDAVERVLVEMGHARTARAYMRYRDRHMRLRALRGGDVRAIWRELDRAQTAVETLEATEPQPLFVRTSDRLAGWDMERIVGALVREARMPEGLARMVALEVEEQIGRAGLTTLTAALVRELVDARLVEHGLEKYRRRHMRLGVPLYDTERIICTPNQDEREGYQDPVSTDTALAHRVKREFALAAVHSAEVTDAHLRGDLHLHGLEQVDRLVSGRHTPEFLVRFGLCIGAHVAPPPKTTDALIAQMARFTGIMQRHFIDCVAWRGFAAAVASVQGAAPEAVEHAARLALFALTSTRPACPTELELRYDSGEALAFAEAFIRVWGETLDAGHDFGVPFVRVPVRPQDLVHEEFRRLLAAILATHERRARARISFERNATFVNDAWACADVVGAATVINLPRLAMAAPTSEAFFDALRVSARLSVQAAVERKTFLERLYAFGGVGPFAALGFKNGGIAYLNLDNAIFLAAITGLNECVEVVTGESLHRSAAAREFAERVLQRLRDELRARAEAAGISVDLAADNDDQVARRFATLDLQVHSSRARAVVKSDPMTRDVMYTPGVACLTADTPNARARTEGAFHALLGHPAMCTVSFGDSDPESSAVVSLVEKSLLQTACATLRFA